MPPGQLHAGSDVPPRHVTAVAIVCDAGFLPYAVYLAEAVGQMHPEPNFDIVVAGPDLPDLPPRLEAARLVRVQGDNPFAHRQIKARRSHAAYLCLLLPDLLPEYDRILYLDCDIGVNGPMAEALSLDLHGEALGAVRDNQQWRTPGRRVDEFARLGWAAQRYLNSGVLLFDGPRWREEGWSRRCIEAARDPALARGYVRNDQSALNLALRGRWTELSPVWNWQWTQATRFFADEADARLIHFIGPQKPWKTASLPPRFTRGYAGFLARHFAEAPPQPQPVPRDLPSLGRPLLRHWLRRGAMQTYLARFPDPLDTHPPDLYPPERLAGGGTATGKA